MTIENMRMSVDDVQDTGFASLPPGRYQVITDTWQAVSKATGNVVLWIDLYVQDEEYVGERLRYFHTLMPQPGEDDDKKSRRNKKINQNMFLEMLKTLGILTQDDVGSVDITFVVGQADEDDRVPITAININDDARSVQNRQVYAVLTQNDNSQSGVGVSRLESIAGASPTSARRAAPETPW